MKKSHCCKAEWHWEQLQGMRLYKTVGRRKIYKAMCGHCGTYYQVTGAGTPITEKTT